MISALSLTTPNLNLAEFQFALGNQVTAFLIRHSSPLTKKPISCRFESNLPLIRAIYSTQKSVGFGSNQAIYKSEPIRFDPIRSEP